MPVSIQGSKPAMGLDAAVAEVGAITARDESADAQSLRATGVDRRLAANNERQKLRDLQRQLKEQQEQAKKPSLLGKITGVVGRAFAAVITAGYSVAIEAALLATSKDKRSLGDQLFDSPANKVFQVVGFAMGYWFSFASLIGVAKEGKDKTNALNRSAKDVEHTATNVDKIRKEMTRSLELQTASDDRAAASHEDVQRMNEALNNVSRAVARSMQAGE